MVSRSEAGKRAWAKKSPAEKSRIIARLRGFKGRGKTKKTGGTRTAKKKNGNGGSKKQSIMSWVINGISLMIGLSNVFARAGQAMKDGAVGDKLGFFGRLMVQDYTGLAFSGPTWTYGGFDVKRTLRGYAPIAGGIAFKVGMGALIKKANVKSLIPRLGLRG